MYKRQAYVYHVEGLDRAGRTTRFAPLAFAVPDAGAPGPLLRQNQPNPFTSATTLAYRVPAGPGDAGTPVHLEVVDVAGRRVRLIFEGVEPPGDYARTWDGRDDRGAPAAAGAYFARLRVGERTAARKLLLAR